MAAKKPLPRKRKGTEYPAALVPSPFIPGLEADLLTG
jgi:hypothetical protein